MLSRASRLKACLKGPRSGRKLSHASRPRSQEFRAVLPLYAKTSACTRYGSTGDYSYRVNCCQTSTTNTTPRPIGLKPAHLNRSETCTPKSIQYPAVTCVSAGNAVQSAGTRVMVAERRSVLRVSCGHDADLMIANWVSSHHNRAEHEHSSSRRQPLSKRKGYSMYSATTTTGVLCRITTIRTRTEILFEIIINYWT